MWRHTPGRWAGRRADRTAGAPGRDGGCRGRGGSDGRETSAPPDAEQSEMLFASAACRQEREQIQIRVCQNKDPDLGSCNQKIQLKRKQLKKHNFNTTIYCIVNFSKTNLHRLERI